MVNWQLIGRAGARYTLLYGGTTAALLTLVGRPLLLLGLIFVGLLLLIFVAGGFGTVRMGTSAANAQAMGMQSAVTDPVKNSEFHQTIEADLKLLFYAIGLLVFGFLGMMILG